MKKPTPMSRLKTPITEFKTVMDNIIIKDYILNESKPKYNPYGGDNGWGGTSKGVENEFLRIFETRKEKSFAFIFNNIKKDLDQVLITVTMKLKNKYVQRTFSYNEFKTKLKELTKTLSILREINTLDDKSFYVSLEKIFGINEKINGDEIIKKFMSKINSEINSKKDEIKKINKKNEKEEKDFEIHLETIRKEVEKLKIEKKHAELKKIYEDAKKTFLLTDKLVKKKEADLKKEFKIKRQRDLTFFENEKTKLENEIKTIIANAVRPYNKAFRKKIEDIYFSDNN